MFGYVYLGLTPLKGFLKTGSRLKIHSRTIIGLEYIDSTNEDNHSEPVPAKKKFFSMRNDENYYF